MCLGQGQRQGRKDVGEEERKRMGDRWRGIEGSKEMDREMESGGGQQGQKDSEEREVERER